MRTSDWKPIGTRTRSSSLRAPTASPPPSNFNAYLTQKHLRFRSHCAPHMMARAGIETGPHWERLHDMQTGNTVKR